MGMMRNAISLKQSPNYRDANHRNCRRAKKSTDCRVTIQFNLQNNNINERIWFWQLLNRDKIDCAAGIVDVAIDFKSIYEITHKCSICMWSARIGTRNTQSRDWQSPDIYRFRCVRARRARHFGRLRNRKLRTCHKAFDATEYEYHLVLSIRLCFFFTLSILKLCFNSLSNWFARVSTSTRNANATHTQ